MDSLALLCNLYGDGPATLRRLRETGLASLEAIAEAEPERLAGVLRTSVRSARRFQSEGRLLIERTAAGDSPSPARGAPVPVEAQRSDPLLEKVLETWRRLDDEQVRPPSALEEAPPAPAEALKAPAEPNARHAAAMNLEEAAIDGLDLALRERLAHSGILTLEDLTSCDPLQLSSSEGFALTRVLHWQLLGRRALARVRRSSSAPESDVGIELTEHGILHPAPPLGGARQRAAANNALLSVGLAPQPLADFPLTARALPLRFSPAEGPPVDASARPQLELRSELDLRSDLRAPPESGSSSGEALDSAGPFA